jgi:hypothetical protein
MQGGLTKRERTSREDWPVVNGSWRCAGAKELPCELVREWSFVFRIGGPSKAVQIPEEGNGS